MTKFHLFPKGRVGYASSPFTAAVAAACREVGFSLMFKELGGVHPPVTLEKRMKGAFSLAMELVATEVTGVLMQPVQNVTGFEQINREMLAAFRKRRIPVVLVDHDICYPPVRSGCDVVCMDNFHAGYAIGRHLVERGAKKIAFLMHGDWAPSVKERLHGLSMAVQYGAEWKPLVATGGLPSSASAFLLATSATEISSVRFTGDGIFTALFGDWMNMTYGFVLHLF